MSPQRTFHPRSFLLGIAFLGMLVTVLASVAPLRAAATLTCDGLICYEQSHCGGGCICNPYEDRCVENVEE